VATYYAGFYRNPLVRSLLLFNGFSYVDPNIAGILHDCMNVFSCSPPSRPDLPVYFYSRFLFSPGYLAKVRGHTGRGLMWVQWRGHNVGAVEGTGDLGVDVAGSLSED
jgi:hypothetical protein